MLGTMILTLLGTGGNCQLALSTNTGVASSPQGEPLSGVFSWACGQSRPFFDRTSLIRNIDAAGLSLGIWVAGGVTKGHVNPVVRPFS